MLEGFEKQEAEATKLYREVDSDQSGMIEKAELTTLLGQLNIGLEDEHVSISHLSRILVTWSLTRPDAVVKTEFWNPNYRCDLSQPTLTLLVCLPVQKVRRWHVQKV